MQGLNMMNAMPLRIEREMFFVAYCQWLGMQQKRALCTIPKPVQSARWDQFRMPN